MPGGVVLYGVLVRLVRVVRCVGGDAEVVGMRDDASLGGLTG
jgi:hypothetical protein